MVLAAHQMNWGPFVNSYREAMQREQETKDDLFSSHGLTLVTLVSQAHKDTSWTQFLELKGDCILLVRAGKPGIGLPSWICGGRGKD